MYRSFKIVVVPFICFLLFVPLGLMCKKSLPNPKSWRFSCMFPSRNFIVLGLCLVCFFELNFIYGIRWRFCLIFWHVAILVSWHHLWKSILLRCFSTLAKDLLITYVRIYFWALFLSHWSMYLSLSHFYTVLIIIAL